MALWLLKVGVSLLRSNNDRWGGRFPRKWPLVRNSWPGLMYMYIVACLCLSARASSGKSVHVGFDSQLDPEFILWKLFLTVLKQSEHTKPFKQCYVRVFVNEQSSSVHNFITLSVLYSVSSIACLKKVLRDRNDEVVCTQRLVWLLICKYPRITYPPIIGQEIGYLLS